MTLEDVKRRLAEASTPDDRKAAIRAGLREGLALSEMETLLDWVDRGRGGLRTADRRQQVADRPAAAAPSYRYPTLHPSPRF